MVTLVSPIVDLRRSVGGSQPGLAPFGEGTQPESLFGQVASGDGGNSGPIGGVLGGIADIIIESLPPPSKGTPPFIPDQPLSRGMPDAAPSGDGGFLSGLANNPLFQAGIAGLSGGNPLTTFLAGQRTQTQARETLFNNALKLQRVGQEQQQIEAARAQRQQAVEAMAGFQTEIEADESFDSNAKMALRFLNQSGNVEKFTETLFGLQAGDHFETVRNEAGDTVGQRNLRTNEVTANPRASDLLTEEAFRQQPRLARARRAGEGGPAGFGEAIGLVNLMAAAQAGELTPEQEAALSRDEPEASSEFESFEFVRDRLGRLNRIGLRDGGATAINLGPVGAGQAGQARRGDSLPVNGPEALSVAPGLDSLADPIRESGGDFVAPDQASVRPGSSLSSDAFDPFSLDQPVDLDLESLGAVAQEAGPQALGGFFDALENTADVLERTVPLGTFDFADGRLVHRPVDPTAERGFPAIAPAETTGGDLVRGVSQFLTGFIPAFKGAELLKVGKAAEGGAKALGAGPRLAQGAGTLAEAEAAALAGGQVVFNPSDPNLINLLIEHTDLRGPVLDFLSTDPADREAENRLGNGLVDLGLGAFAGPLVQVFKGYRRAATRVEPSPTAVTAARPKRLERDPELPTSQQVAAPGADGRVEPRLTSGLASMERRISEFVRSIRGTAAKNDAKKRQISLGPVSVRDAREIAESARASGLELDVSDFNHTIDNFGVRHTLKTHGSASTEFPRGLLPVSDDDFTRIPEIIAKRDRVSFDGATRIGRPSVVYEKAFPDGDIKLRYVTEARGNRKTLTLVSMTKRPNPK